MDIQKHHGYVHTWVSINTHTLPTPVLQSNDTPAATSTSNAQVLVSGYHSGELAHSRAGTEKT